jgi:predicted transcriptional regulator
MRIVAALGQGRTHVSQLARDLQMSRPLLYLHLQKLEGAGVVKGSLELASDGKAMKYFEVVPFQVELTPATISAAAATLTRDTGDTAKQEDN